MVVMPDEYGRKKAFVTLGGFLTEHNYKTDLPAGYGKKCAARFYAGRV
jgi:hypothetical protein